MSFLLTYNIKTLFNSRFRFRPVLCLLFLCTMSPAGNGQDSNLTRSLIFSGYAEIYYTYDPGRPENHTRPFFFYSFNRHNELNLNLGLIKASYGSGNVRSDLAFMAGTYAQYNLAAEPGLLQNIFQADIGIKISNRKNLWVDAGIMPSHIGFESAIGKDCWNLTRSILADNTPYYETGIKIGFTSENEKLYAAAMYLNGWQRIHRIDGNQTPAFGTQLLYKPNARAILNWSTFIGNEQPDSLMQWRYFNNFYGQFQLGKKLALTAGFDAGMQQEYKGSSSYYIWYSPVLIIQYTVRDKIKIGMRGEYYMDEDGVIILTGTPNGFQTSGYSMNVDYSPFPNFVLRAEVRGLNSKDKIFLAMGQPSYKNYFFTASLAISF
jgi:hypothetical protein